MTASELQRRVVDLDGHPLEVRTTSGDGRPVLLLHGWTATAKINWGNTLDRLGGRWQFTCFDHRGHGTGVPRGPRPVSIERYAEDAVRVLDQLEYDKVTVVGYSMGGAVAQQLWKIAPERVEGIVLAASATHFVGDGVGRQAAKAALFAGALISRNLNVVQKKVIQDRIVGNRIDDEGFPKHFAGDLSGHDLTALAEAGQSVVDFDSRGWITECDIPVAVVATVSDTVIPFKRQIETVRLVRGSKLHPVAGGHSVCLERAEEFNRVLHEALEGVTF